VTVSPGGELYVVGTAADDQVRFTRTGDVYELEAGKGPALRAGSGCRQSTRKVAVCPVAGVTRITVTTGDGLDQVLTSGLEPFAVPVAISTGPGHDYVQLYGVVAPVAVSAGEGDDYVISGSGADRLDGGEGDDQISGMAGADTLLGGPGDDFLEDTIRESPPATDTLDCGPGIDEPRAELGIDVVTACEQPPSEWSVWSSSSFVKYRYAGSTSSASSVYAGLPASIQPRKTATRSAGQAPSHGIVPASNRARIASACVETSSSDQRSKAKRIALRSPSRNSGLMSSSKCIGSSSVATAVALVWKRLVAPQSAKCRASESATAVSAR
jgi:hypothetical protein